jgi:ribosome-associated protein
MTSDSRISMPDPGEIEFQFFRSSGPGGQNVNKVATAVRLRFDVGRSRSLPEEVKARLAEVAANRMTAGGSLVIEARRFRTQERNRQDALARLHDLIVRASRKPRRRKPTKRTAVSRERRLAEKRLRSAVKRERAKDVDD